MKYLLILALFVSCKIKPVTIVTHSADCGIMSLPVLDVCPDCLQFNCVYYAIEKVPQTYADGLLAILKCGVRDSKDIAYILWDANILKDWPEILND